MGGVHWITVCFHCDYSHFVCSDPNHYDNIFCWLRGFGFRDWFQRNKSCLTDSDSFDWIIISAVLFSFICWLYYGFSCFCLQFLSGWPILYVYPQKMYIYRCISDIHLKEIAQRCHSVVDRMLQTSYELNDVCFRTHCWIGSVSATFYCRLSSLRRKESVTNRKSESLASS